MLKDSRILNRIAARIVSDSKQKKDRSNIWCLEQNSPGLLVLNFLALVRYVRTFFLGFVGSSCLGGDHEMKSIWDIDTKQN